MQNGKDSSRNCNIQSRYAETKRKYRSSDCAGRFGYHRGQWFEKYDDVALIQSGDYQGKPLIPRNGVFLLKMFLSKALSSKVKERYHSMDEALADLDRIIDCFYNYKIQLIDYFEEFLPPHFSSNEQLEHLEHIFWGEAAKKYRPNKESYIVSIISKTPDIRKNFAKFYATLYRTEYDSIHEIYGEDLDSAFKSLHFFQNSNTTVYDSLKQAIQDQPHPTLIIYYDERKSRRRREAKRRNCHLQRLLNYIDHNLHLLIVTEDCYPVCWHESGIFKHMADIVVH